MFDWTKDPHRQFNPLTGNGCWCRRTARIGPWQGRWKTRAVAAQPDYDPNCYLCPGNSRAGRVRNPAYSGTFVFDNDFCRAQDAAHRWIASSRTVCCWPNRNRDSAAWSVSRRATT